MKNQNIVSLTQELKKASIESNVKLWKRVAIDLLKTGKNKRIVNLSKIDKYAKDDETVIVPGKVLSMGDLSKKITIAAHSFSDSALDKIKDSGSKAITIRELLKNNPKGKKVRIMG